MTKAKRAMQEDIKLIDVIIELVDARIPRSSKNPDIDSLAQGKSRILLLNKSDMADAAKTMEDRKLNEKESLELITQMIRNTRRNLDAGSGNMFLLWGYVCVLLTLVVWAGVGLTQNSAWMWGFWGIPVVGYLLSYIFMRRKDKPVSLYIDKVLNEMWQFMGIVCLAVALMAAYFHAFEVILPLCAILLSLGSIFTGVLIRYTRFSGLSSMGVLLGLRMLFEVWDKSSFLQILPEFVLVVILAMIIPGHILNYKAKKENKNKSK